MTEVIRSEAPAASAEAGPARTSMRPLVMFAAFALVVGGVLLALSTVVEPDGPFLLAAVLGGLALPALVLTGRETGAAGVKALLRDCVRLPRSWWWLVLAGFGLPALAWIVGAALGGAQPLTWSLLGFYAVDLLIGALVINIWEEMAWTGYFQRRAMGRWGVVVGSIVTAAFFTALHVPLAFDGAASAGEVWWNVLLIAGVGAGLRLLIARVDAWSGGSLLTVGVLHSSFNATESVLDPAYDWVRIVVTVVVGVALVAVGRGRGRGAVTAR
jgi:membrane protease YdiL (CAAX protease family)